MNSETVVLCYPATESDVSKIESVFPRSRVICSNQDDISKDIFDATIFCGHAKRRQIDWDAVVANGALKWIQSSAAGLDHCLVPAVIESDIVVSGCSGLFAKQVGEQTLALLLGIIRRLPVFVHAQSRKEFVRRPTDTLNGKTVGIVGFGGNGRRIAAILKNMVASILATDLFPDFEPPDYVDVLPADQINQLFQVSDVVIVTLPLTIDTKHLIGSEQFNLMKEGSYFVNVARGSVVVQSALINALESGRLAYAGLDVLEPEPPADEDTIWNTRNLLITPHVGAQSADRVPLTTDLFCQNAQRFRHEEVLFNLVDKQLQFPRPEHRFNFE